MERLSRLPLELAAHIYAMVDRRGRREDGQGMVEYALILVLIAVTIIVMLSIVGKRVNNTFSNISSGLNTN